MSKVHEVLPGVEYDKRFYVPGVVITRICEKCGATLTWDGSDNYLSYPEVGKPLKINLYCGGCDHDQKVVVKLGIAVTEVE